MEGQSIVKKNPFKVELKFKYSPSWKGIEIKSNNPMKMKWPWYLIQKLSVKKKKRGGGVIYSACLSLPLPFSNAPYIPTRTIPMNTWMNGRNA